MTEGAKELTAMEMLGGELRWMKMDKEEVQIKFLLEERRLEDEYHRMKKPWRPRRNDMVDWELYRIYAKKKSIQAMTNTVKMIHGWQNVGK